MRSIADLKAKGIEMTPELKERTLKRVWAKLSGEDDGTLDEPLHEIVINEDTAIKLNKELEKYSD